MHGVAIAIRQLLHKCKILSHPLFKFVHGLVI